MSSFLSKRIVLVLLIVFFGITIFLILLPRWYGGRKNYDEDRGYIQPEPQKYRELPNGSKYDASHYIIPLDDNRTGSVYSKRAQIQGTVISWKMEQVIVDTKGERINIAIPNNVRILCLPPLPSGEKTGIIYDLKNLSRTSGYPIESRGSIREIFTKITTIFLVEVGFGDKLTAYLIFGLGCVYP